MLSRSARVASLCAAPFVFAALLAGCGGNSQSPLPSQAATSSQVRSVEQPLSQLTPDTFQQELASGRISPVCNRNVGPGQASCLSYILNNPSSAPRAAGHPDVSGYGPADLQAAYNFAGSIGNPGGTVVLVLWYNDPNMDADLTKYRSTFGLPPCTEKSGCLKQVDQTGGNKLPQDDQGAGLEESLDVDMVSANCPNCKIIYVEANQPNTSDLLIAENTAAKLAGVNGAMSNSWDTPGTEITKPKSFVQAFNHPDQAVVSSAGDAGYSVSSPADYNTLTAAVGTTLRKDGSSRGWSESVWGGTGSGCSKVIASMPWQQKIEKKLSGCTKRVVGDVAYVADPGTGVAVYDSYGYGGFIVVGGTSVSAPAEAALYALSGKTAGIPAHYAYSHRKQFYDVTTGINGTCAPHAWLCSGETGYDAPTGVGTPNGIGGF